MPPADRRPDDAPEDREATETPSSAFRVFGRIGQEPMWFEEQEAPAPPADPDEPAEVFGAEIGDELSASGAFDFAPDEQRDDPFAAEPDAWAPGGGVGARERRSSAAREPVGPSQSVPSRSVPSRPAPARPASPGSTAEDDDLAFAGLPVQGFGAPFVDAGDADDAPLEAPAARAGADDGATPWYRNAACWAHLAPLGTSVLLLTGLGLVPPLLIENTAGRRDDFVRDQAREALNFQLNVLLLNVVALLTLTAPLVWPLSIAFAIVLPIQAAMDANRGERHRYPIVPRWLD